MTSSILAIGLGFVGVLLSGCADLRGTPAAGSEPCECEDWPDINSRLKQVRAVIQVLKTEIDIIKKEEVTTGETVEFDNERKERIEAEKMKVAMNQVVDEEWRKGIKGIRQAKGYTERASCTINNYAETPCLRKYTQVHEAVHQAACAQIPYHKRVFKNPGDGYLGEGTLVQWAEGEINGYSAEIPLIEADLNRLNKACELMFEVDLRQEAPASGPTGGLTYVSTQNGMIPLVFDPIQKVFTGKGKIKVGISYTGTEQGLRCGVEMVPPTSHSVEVTVEHDPTFPTIRVRISQLPDGGFVARCYFGFLPVYTKSFPLSPPPPGTVEIPDWVYHEKGELMAVHKVPDNGGEFRIRRLAPGP
jgi:hypothetical protein